MQISTTFGISDLHKKKTETKKQNLTLCKVFFQNYLYLSCMITDLASSIVCIYRLPQLRGRVAVHAEQVDDAATEAGREALLPRHLLQGKPHSACHWPFTGTG